MGGKKGGNRGGDNLVISINRLVAEVEKKEAPRPAAAAAAAISDLALIDILFNRRFRHLNKVKNKK